MVYPSSSFNSQLSHVQCALSELNINEKKTRADKWDPRPHNEQPSKQEALNCISLLDPWRSQLLEEQNLAWKSNTVLLVKDREYKIASDPVKLAELYTDLINHHVTMRVALFFQQAIICYKTPFHFEVAPTEGQVFCAKNLKIKTKNDPSIVIKYQAAHSSTIPSLKACPIEDYLTAQANDREPKYFSFLGDSYMADLDNSTVSLPSFVNQIDTLVDCKTEGLRDFAIDLLNELAEDNATPCEATQFFLEEFLIQLREGLEKSKKMTPEKKKTISLYKRQVKNMIKTIKADEDSDNKSTFFDNLLSVNVSREENTDISIIRQIVYKRKFEIIREAQCTEAKIQSAIYGRFPFAKKPAQKHIIKLCLATRVKNYPDLKAPLQKLFAISIDTIEKDRKLCEKMEQEYAASPTHYDNALRDMRQLVNQFQKMETNFQAMLLQDFRKKLRNMTQLELSNAIKNIILEKINTENGKLQPRIKKIDKLEAMAKSKSTIARLENSSSHILKTYKTPENQRRKDITLSHAKIISKALRVDPGHYFCSFFASAEVV